MTRVAATFESDRAAGHDAGELPFVSIIVPVYNDPTGVGETLASLTALDYPTDRYEVIVADNNSTDDTRRVVERVADAHRNVSLVVERARQSSYAARNRGIGASTGELLAFVDADMHVDPDWLSRVVAELDRSGADYMGCAVELYSPNGAPTLADRFDAARGFDIERYIADLDFAPTCCLVVRRAVIEAVGEFDDRLVSSGDMEFGNRVADAGFSLHFARDIPMYHPTRSSVRANVKKAVRIGRGRYQLAQFYPDRYGSATRLLVNPRGYLPPVPWLLQTTFRDWHDRSREEKLALYALATLTSMARSYGHIAEAVDVQRRRRTQRRGVESAP